MSAEQATTKTIRVTLAEVPTDVLVYLVDNGAATSETIATAVAPPGCDIDDARASVGRALSLLREGGWVRLRERSIYFATPGGIAAVEKARAASGVQS